MKAAAYLQNCSFEVLFALSDYLLHDHKYFTEATLLNENHAMVMNSLNGFITAGKAFSIHKIYVITVLLL